VLNAVLPSDAFDIVMNLAGIGIAGTWIMVLVTHLAFLKKVKAGEEERPAFRMPGAPVTNWVAIAFFAIVVLSGLADPAGRWTLALFGVVIVALVIGWYRVRGHIRGDLMDEILDDSTDEALEEN
jgi:L-asparagine permease